MTVPEPTASIQCTAERCRRIAVVGTTGSGKTTLARRLAQRLGQRHVELDALYWEPKWTPAATDAFRKRAAQALSGDGWVVDGNYGQVRDIIWSRADTIVWLDYSLPIIFWRLVRRTFWRVGTQAELWNGNHERLREQFFSRDSLFLWALRTYRRRRRQYPLLFGQPEHAHLAVVRLRSPQAARDWLAGITMQAAPASAEQQAPGGTTVGTRG
jgi:adenylate kinase family enzyme